MPKQTAKDLKQMCEERGWTLEDLASASGIRKSTVYNYANGQTGPDVDNVARLAEAMAVPNGDVVDACLVSRRRYQRGRANVA